MGIGWGFDDVISILRGQRFCWFSGRTSIGKTSLAFRVAYEFCTKYGYKHILTNIYSPWADNLDDVNLYDDNMLHSIIILDEGGLYLKGFRDVETFLAFLAKLDIIILCPSHVEPAAALQKFEVFGSWKPSMMGLPGTIYNWRLRYGMAKDHGWCWWSNPSEVWGVYDRQDVPVDDGGIEEWLSKQIDEVGKRKGRRNFSERRKIKLELSSMGEVGGSSWSTEAIEAAVERFSAAAENLETISLPRRKTSK